VGGSSKNERKNANTERQYNVEKAFARAISMPGVQVRRDHCEHVRRRGKQEGVDVVVPKSFYNLSNFSNLLIRRGWGYTYSREKVRYGSR
jgi:hypothetical protein